MWYVLKDGKAAGPITPEDLRKMADHGLLKPTDSVRAEGIEKWVEARKVKGLFPDPEEAKWMITPDPEPPEPVAVADWVTSRTHPANAVGAGSDEAG